MLLVFLLSFVSSVLGADQQQLVTNRVQISQLNQAGRSAFWRADYPAALVAWQQGLEVARHEGNQQAVGVFLVGIGRVYNETSQYWQALEHFESALALFHGRASRRSEAAVLTNIGIVYDNLGEYQLALTHYERAVNLFREAYDRPTVGATLSNIGVTYENVGQYEQALGYFQQALAIYREVGDRRGEGDALSNIGMVWRRLGQYQRALRLYEQALVIHRKLGDRSGEGNDLLGIGVVYWSLGYYQRALENYESALAIHRQIRDRRREGGVLSNIGVVHRTLGNYHRALKHYEQAFAIRNEIGDRRGVANDLGNLGLAHRQLGQYQRALEFYKQALAIQREIGDRRSMGITLGNIGVVYSNLSQYPLALAYYERALDVSREVGDRRGTGRDLTNIGIVYDNLVQHSRALEYYRQALAIFRDIGDRHGEGTGLLNIGASLHSQHIVPQAQGYLQQALAIHTDVGVADSLWRIWYLLGRTFAAQFKPTAAIFAGKQATNILQAMRRENQALTQVQQQSFLNNKIVVYQGLADLLLTQNRPVEAQQVLDMLKESEFYDYIQQDDAHDPRTLRVAYNAVETQWNQAFDQVATDLSATAKALGNLTRIHVDIRTSEEQAEITRLTEQRDALSARVQQHLDDLITDLKATPAGRQAELNAKMNQLPGNKPSLLAKLTESSGTRTGLLQFILLPDQVRILLTTPDGWHTEVAEVDKDQLDAEIEALRAALADRRSEPKAPAQVLYQRLVAPLADAIDAAKLQSLMVQLDGRLRYIPFAALHDGEQWLAERWSLVYYTAASERQAELASTDWRVAGFGTTGAHGKFPALLEVRDEVEGIVRKPGEDADQGVLPGIVRLDEAFTRDALWQGAAGGFNILHIASHFDLKPGNDSQSSLLLGNGELLSLRQLREFDDPKLDLRHVDLVTLSACDTAMGGADATGAEIEGMGAIVQRQGARGVLASLWSVADASTGKLMQTLYRLRGGEAHTSKAQALQQAQLSLLYGPDSGQRCDGTRGKTLELGTGKNWKDSPCRWSHPYYWAPFILMGNWL